jgi:hypothetical protein
LYLILFDRLSASDWIFSQSCITVCISSTVSCSTNPERTMKYELIYAEHVTDDTQSEAVLFAIPATELDAVLDYASDAMKAEYGHGEVTCWRSMGATAFPH